VGGEYDSLYPIDTVIKALQYTNDIETGFDALRMRVCAASSTTYCTGARHVISPTLYKCSPRHPPIAASSIA